MTEELVSMAASTVEVATCAMDKGYDMDPSTCDPRPLAAERRARLAA